MAWPKCPKCKAPGRSATTPETSPPDPVTAQCSACGHEWAICGAKNRAGGRCGKAPMENGRCDLHGGKSTGRPLIHGRRSKFLPVRLGERAEEALADRDLISMAEDIALTDAMITEEYECLGEESHAHLWSLAVETFDALDACTAEGDLSMEPKAGVIFERLRDILTNGMGRYQAEAKIMLLQEHKRKLSDTEIKRQTALNQYVSAKELNALMALILTIIRETVKDPGERALVGSKLIGVVRPVIGGRASG